MSLLVRLPHLVLRGGSTLRRQTSLATLCVGVAALVPAGAQAANLTANTSNFASVYAASKGGDVIRLATGNYGTFRGSASKAATVNIAPLTGAKVTMSVDFRSVSYIRLDNITIAGATIDNSHHIAFTNSTFTQQATVAAQRTSANIVFDHDKFDAINMCSTCYEGRLTVRGYENKAAVGVTVRYSHFGGGGESDGVQVIGGAYGVTVGPGNEFVNLREGNYTAHVDPIQLYGSSHTLMTGNYFHGNSTAIMAGDGGDHERVENNVFVMDEYPWAVVASHIPGLIMRHNTVTGGSLHIDDSINPGSSSQPTTATITDNAGTINYGTHGTVTESYNIFSGAKGSHDINAKPKFAGGTSPTSRAGFALASGSPGTKVASDKTDMGISAGAATTAGPAAAIGDESTTPNGVPEVSADNPDPDDPAATTAPAVSVPNAAATAGVLDVPAAAPTAAAPMAVPAAALAITSPSAVHRRFTKRLRLAFKVTAGASAIDRVAFLVDNRWVRTVRRAPFTLAWQAPKGLRYGLHVVKIRAFARDGSSSTLKINVRRVRG